MRVGAASLLEPIAVLVAAIYAAALFWAMNEASYDIWGALLLAPLLLTAVVVVGNGLARREADPVLGHLIVLALVLKIIGGFARYYVSLEVYDRADALAYHDAGAAFAEQFRQGDFSIDAPEFIGTTFIEIVTGVIYTFTGATMLGGFLVYSLLGFCGLYLFYRAFRRALPEADPKRYLLLVLLLPSLLFWPSSIGKEAWMVFALGLVADGAARMLTRSRGGVVVLVFGLVATAAVRPHVTLIVFVGLAAGYLLRRKPQDAGQGLPGAKLLGLVALAIGGVVVAVNAEQFLGVESLDPSSVSEVLDQTEGQTTGGNSGFEAPAVNSPLDVPWAVVSVLYRPFPWEAHNLQALAQAVEGLVLIAITLRSLPRMAALPRLIRRRPYLGFVIVYALLFVVAFSTLGNFGIIVRQRVQVYPFALVLLCLPARARPAPRQPELGRIGAHAA